MIDINYARAMELVDQAIEQRGADYVYTNEDGDKAVPHGFVNCYNWHEDEDGSVIPGCIVGTVLHMAGVPLDEMGKEDGWEDVENNLSHTETLRATRKASKLLEYIQYEQDKGNTWGVSKANAEEYVKNWEIEKGLTYGHDQFEA